MAQPDAIANAVRGRFAEEVADAEDLLTVYDNAPDQTVPPNSRWCRLTVQLGERRVVSVAGAGGRRFRTTGVALAQVFEPLGVGDGELLEIVATIQEAFEVTDLAGPPQIHFFSPYVSAPPIREDSWWNLVVTIPFQADEFA